MKLNPGDKVQYTPIRGGEPDGKTYIVRATGKLPSGIPVVWLEGARRDPLMSRTKRKYPRGEAIAVARELVHLLWPACCEKLKVAGSLRRGALEVGDVEIVYIPLLRINTEGKALFDELENPVSVVDFELDRLLERGVIAKRAKRNGQFTWGRHIKLAVHCATGIPVDFFATNPDSWWNYLVCRTGPAALNMAIATSALAQGLKWTPYGTGFEREDGTVLPVRSEEDVFKLAGLPFLPPKDR